MSVFWWSARSRWVCKWKDQNGKERRRVFKDEDEALSFDEDVHEEIERLKSNAPSLIDLAVMYLQETKPHHRTALDISRYLEQGCAEFADKPADALSKRDLLTMRQALQHLAPKTINNAQTYVTAILNFGVEQELIYRNPWAGAKKLKTQRRIPTATIEDFRKIFNHAAPHLVWAFDVALNLALRPGEVELLRLKWNAFNWQGGYATVQQAKGVPPKTVHLAPSFLERAWQQFQTDDEMGIRHVINFNGRPVTSIRTAWLAAKRRAGLADADIRPYDIRHLAASTMLAAGADLAAVSAQLGHQSIATTANIYAHVIGDAQKRAAKKLPDFLGSPRQLPGSARN